MEIRLVEMREMTRSEERVLAPLLKGLPEKIIAADLKLSKHTVHAHIKRIYRRCGVNSRAELLGMLVERMSKVMQAVESPPLVPTATLSPDGTKIFL